VAERAGVVVGFSGIHGNTVSWLFVHPLHRRALIAETLLQIAIVGVQGNIELNVVKSNEAAVRLYEKLGFNNLREVTGSFNGQDCQVLRLQLPRDADQSDLPAG
jgi:ribosomal protein S18 acetylase RimI-like enzyme